MKSSIHVALISNIQGDLEDDVDEKCAKEMKVVDQFQRCRIAELQRAQSRSNFAHKNVTFIKSLSLFCNGQHDLSDGDDGDDDVGEDGDGDGDDDDDVDDNDDVDDDDDDVDDDNDDVKL